MLVTGGASGIGAATVARFQQDGARVAVLDRDAARLAGIAAEARLEADVSVENEVIRAVDAAAEALEGLDVVVNCAGVGGDGTVADTPLERWERIFAVNVRGTFLTSKAAIPHLRRAGGGVIVNVASQFGLVGAANSAAYCASKGGVVQLTRAMAIDHAGEGIRVACVCPGPTDTPMLAAYFERCPDPEAERRRKAGTQLHGRLLAPGEIADAIHYLASPSASSAIGTVLVLDGGYTIL